MKKVYLLALSAEGLEAGAAPTDEQTWCQERQLVLGLGPGASRVRPGPLVSKSREVLRDYGDVSMVPEATL